jgi:hypothetical protein
VRVSIKPLPSNPEEQQGRRLEIKVRNRDSSVTFWLHVQSDSDRKFGQLFNFSLLHSPTWSAIRNGLGSNLPSTGFLLNMVHNFGPGPHLDLKLDVWSSLEGQLIPGGLDYLHASVVREALLDWFATNGVLMRRVKTAEAISPGRLYRMFTEMIRDQGPIAKVIPTRWSTGLKHEVPGMYLEPRHSALMEFRVQARDEQDFAKIHDVGHALVYSFEHKGKTMRLLVNLNHGSETAEFTLWAGSQEVTPRNVARDAIFGQLRALRDELAQRCRNQG